MTETQRRPLRVKGWEIALVETVERHATTPFDWGSSDCLTLAGDVVAALTGDDPMAGHRGAYRTGSGAAQRLKAHGFADLGAALCSRFEPVAPAMARRGDIGLVETTVRGRAVLACVVVTGAEVVGKSPPGRDGGTGLTVMSRDRLVQAFRVGW